MLKNFVLIALVFELTSCSTADEPMIRKVVCGDSFSQEFFDSAGNPYTMMVPGNCDTIEISQDSAELLEHLELMPRK